MLKYFLPNKICIYINKNLQLINVYNVNTTEISPFQPLVCLLISETFKPTFKVLIKGRKWIDKMDFLRCDIAMKN